MDNLEMKNINKTIITVAPTGAWTNRDENPNLPMEPAEIAGDVYECYKQGASICHLHMRGEDGKGEMVLEKFVETVRLIREKPDCDILINCTTSGSLYATDDIRMAPILELKPEQASFVCGTMNWDNNSLFINHPQFLEKLALTMKECGTKPDIEIYDSGMIYNSLNYIKKGILETPCNYQFIMGEAGGCAATVENLIHLKNLLPSNSTWGAVGVGDDYIPILLATIALNGHVRVGMEDCCMINGRPANSNAELVKHAADLIKMAGKEVATVEETRQILNLR